MGFAKENSDDACVLKNASYETKEEMEMSNFQKEFQYVFMDSIHGELPPKIGQDYSFIDIMPSTLPFNKPPYRVS